MVKSNYIKFQKGPRDFYRACIFISAKFTSKLLQTIIPIDPKVESFVWRRSYAWNVSQILNWNQQCFWQATREFSLRWF